MSKESIYKRYKPAVTNHSTSRDGNYWFIFDPARMLVKENGSIPCSVTIEELGFTPLSSNYLGTLQGLPCYAVEVAPQTAAPSGMTFCDLRSIYSVVDEDLFLLAGKAIQIVNWDRTHRFCGRCGNATVAMDGERAKKCLVCGFASYPRLSPAAITAIFKGEQILLSHNALFRGKMYSLIAGFVEPGETLEECVQREILEEVGIRVKNIKYFGSQPWPFPNSLMIGFTAEYESGEINVDGREISEAGWFSANSLPELPARMSIARQIIDWFIENSPGKPTD